MNFDARLSNVDKWTVDNISGLFVNSGATVHTLLIKPVSKASMEFFSYQPIPTDSESIMRQIARKTGDLARDISEEMRTRVLDWMENRNLADDMKCRVREIMPLALQDQNAMFGESLPQGIILRD